MEINLPFINKGKRKEIFIVVLCLLIGFVLRFYTFDKKSLWIDEIYTFHDSKDGIKDQIKYFKENPADLLHPPLFFVLTNLFYPFTKPERDLRIIPFIFGTLSIPMIYLLAKMFSPNFALPCTLSLTFMTYHISFSQDGRPYSLLLFLGIVSLYFFLKHLKTRKMKYLFLVALFFALSFYTSYASIPFIALSQILWLYQINEIDKNPLFFSFLILNAVTILLCIPWIIFLNLIYKGQPIVNPLFTQELGSFWNILLGILNDWAPQEPLMIISIILLVLFPICSKNRRNAIILLSVFFIPIIGLFLFCKLLNIKHYFSSRYVINFLPLFFITLYLSLDTIEEKFGKLKRFFRLRFLFVIFFIVSNITILLPYYQSEKQNFRGLVTYLESQLRDGDKIFIKSLAYIPGVLHYFGVKPESRYYNIPILLNESEKTIESTFYFFSKNRKFTILYSSYCCAQYVADGSRLWIIVGKPDVKELKENSPCVLKGYFDGSFCNFRRFPSDASLYLFLWDPSSPNEKGIDMPIE